MSTRTTLLKALVLASVIGSASTITVLAATPLTAANKATILSTQRLGAKIDALKAILDAAPAADKEQLAKDIVSLIASQPTVTPLFLKEAVKAVVSKVPASAAVIAVAAAQQLANTAGGNTVRLNDLYKAVVGGAAASAPTDASNIAALVLASAPATVSRTEVQTAAAAGAQEAQSPNGNSTVSNPTDVTVNF